MRYNIGCGSCKYIRFGLNVTKRTTIIVVIFNINQTVRDTSIHLKIDEEQCCC